MNGRQYLAIEFYVFCKWQGTRVRMRQEKIS